MTVFIAGEYEGDIEFNSTWETGDWNGDHEFNTADLVYAFHAGSYTTNASRVQGQPVEAALLPWWRSDMPVWKFQSSHAHHWSIW